MASEISLFSTLQNLQLSSPLFRVEEAIAEVFGPDKIVKLLKEDRPSLADGFVHKEAISKSFYELASGRVVEVLRQKDGSLRCIGSFTYTPDECCAEGWAAYHPQTDREWCQLVANYMVSRGNPDFKQEKAEDWSCGWNSLQNYVYLQTGQKCTVLEAMHCFLSRALDRIGTALQQLDTASNQEEMMKIVEKAIPDFLLMIQFYSNNEGPFFCTNNLTTQLLLNESKVAVCDQNQWENAIAYTPQELIAKIGCVSEHGPLLLQFGPEGHLLYADQGNQLVLIDPHNYDRRPDYPSHRHVQEMTATSRAIHFNTQRLSGKLENYRGCNTVECLGADTSPEVLIKQLRDLQSNGALEVRDVSKALLELATQTEKCNAIFMSKTQ